MKRKLRKSKQKRSARQARAKSKRPVPKKKRVARNRRFRRLSVPKNGRQSLVHRKALAVLSRMRRGMSLARAAKLEHIKQNTFLRYAGNTVYRRGPGKPWKAIKSDRLSAKMTILTEQGPVFAVVRGSVERTRLALYDIALRKFRAGEDGAAEELKKFEGQMVAGYVLITDLDLLVELEQAGQLDFDALYYSAGASI